MNGPRAVSELNAELQIEPSLLSHHLQILREEGWVKNRRVGRSVIYELASSIRRTSKDPTLDLGCCRLSFK
jgi:ArsR family transcriptional regulator